MNKGVTESIIFLDCGPCKVKKSKTTDIILNDDIKSELAWLSDRILDVIEGNDKILMITSDIPFAMAICHHMRNNHLVKNCKLHTPLHLAELSYNPETAIDLATVVKPIKESMDLSEIIIVLVHSETFVELPKALTLDMFNKEVKTYPDHVGFGCGKILYLKNLNIHKLHKRTCFAQDSK